MKVEYIRYKHGMLDRPSQRKKLKAFHLEKNKIPTEIQDLIENKNIVSIRGTLGIKEGAIPIEYEEVNIRTDDGETTFEIYNRGMSWLIKETPEIGQVFELCSRLRQACRL